MAMWNPWRGCHKYSEGCRFCYIHKGDAKRGVDTNVVTKADNFCAPVERYKRGDKKGEYKMKSGETVYLCFSSDFLLPDADQWRSDCWRMMRERPDLNFLFLTKRIERFVDCVPDDWGDGYENVTVGCTVENQAEAYRRLPRFDTFPIVHKNIILQPMLEKMNIERHLGDVELVVVGGESDRNARPLDYGTHDLRFDSVSERYGSTDISRCFETICETNRQKPEYSDAVRSAVPRKKSVKAIFGGSPIIQTARQL